MLLLLLLVAAAIVQQLKFMVVLVNGELSKTTGFRYVSATIEDSADIGSCQKLTAAQLW